MIKTPVELVDLYRTLSEIAGLPEPDADVDGRSLVPLLLDESHSDEYDDDFSSAAFSQYDRCPAAGAKGNVTRWHGACKYTNKNDIAYMGFAIRTRHWRYVVWMRFDGKTNRGHWEDCDMKNMENSSTLCARELYAHVLGAENDFERLESKNLVISKPKVATMLHARLRQEFDCIQVTASSLAAVTANRFVGFTLDWWPCGGDLGSGGDWCNSSVLDAKLDHPRLKSALQLLSDRALLRIGGSMDVEARYLLSPADENWCHEPRLFRGTENITLCMTKERLDEILHLVQSHNIPLIWGLPYPGAYASIDELGDSTEIPVWNATNAKDLLDYAGDVFAAVELGEELTPFPETVSFNNLIDAYARLRSLSPKKRIHGPCVGMAAETDGEEECLDASCSPDPFVQAFIEQNLVDTLCIHSYDNDAGTNWTQLPCSASQLIRQLEMFQKFVRTIPIVCGECGPHNNGGLENITDTAASAFWYLDALGQAARLGVSHFARQTLIGSQYGLLDNRDEYAAPNPDFWIALLFSRLMGPKVLTNSYNSTSTFSLYTHCSPSDSLAMGLAFINYDKELSVTLDLAALVAKRHRWEEWVFTTVDNNLTSKEMVVNGASINRYAPEITLPSPRLSRKYSTILQVQPLSFGFLRFRTDNQVCLL